MCVLSAAVAVQYRSAQPALASAEHHVYRTDGDGAWLHADSDSPTIDSALITVMPEGASFSVECWKIGEAVYGNPVWLHGSYDDAVGDVTDYYIDTHWNTTEDLTNQGLPQCGTTSPEPSPSQELPVYGDYNRSAAVEWASTHAMDAPPYNDSCTWFVSNALWHGGLLQTDEWNDNPNGHGHLNWRPGTAAAFEANLFIDYMLRTYPTSTWTQISLRDNAVPEAEPGDVIAYDWEGRGGIDHLAFVVNIASGQYPEVAEWSIDGTRPAGYPKRGWTWSEKNVAWLQDKRLYPNVVAYLLHIEPGIERVPDDAYRA